MSRTRSILLQSSDCKSLELTEPRLTLDRLVQGRIDMAASMLGQAIHPGFNTHLVCFKCNHPGLLSDRTPNRARERHSKCEIRFARSGQVQRLARTRYSLLAFISSTNKGIARSRFRP